MAGIDDAEVQWAETDDGDLEGLLDYCDVEADVEIEIESEDFDDGSRTAWALFREALCTLDLDAKVQENTIRRAFAAQNKRMILSEYAAVAGAAVNQFIETFDAPADPYARAALRFSPLLLMSPQRKGPGIEGFIKDPRVIGAAAVAALVVIGENRNPFRRARIIITAPTTTPFEGQTITLIADVVDGRGAVLPIEKVTWQSSDPTVAQVDRSTGVVTAESRGFAVITATSGDVVGRVMLSVVPD